jgi:hypothetical protein
MLHAGQHDVSGAHKKNTINRSTAGCFRFFILIQCLDLRRGSRVVRVPQNHKRKASVFFLNKELPARERFLRCVTCLLYDERVRRGIIDLVGSERMGIAPCQRSSIFLPRCSLWVQRQSGF